MRPSVTPTALLAALLVACTGSSSEAPVATSTPVAKPTPAASAPEAPPAVIEARSAPLGEPVPYETVELPAGTYTVGSPPDEAGRDDDEALHEVVMSRAILVGKTEVTQALWDNVMSSNPSKVKDPTLPVDQVSWYDAVRLANALSARDGLTPAYTIDGNAVTFDPSAKGWRLPTEAEWEIAARGGAANQGPYSGGADVNALAWHEGNADGASHKPCQRGANALGLCDMSGNVLEWVWDRYAPYPAGPVTDPRGPDEGGSGRVNRGGSWSYAPDYARVANRNRGVPGVRFVILGVRLVRNA